MSLFKRGNVWWSYLYVDGIRHQQSTGTSNRRQAEAIEAKLKEEVNARRFQIVQADPHMKFSELAARFIASGTVRPHHLYHLKFLLPFFAEMPVHAAHQAMAEEFRQKRKTAARTVKDATVNRDLERPAPHSLLGGRRATSCGNPLARLKMARERRTQRQVLSLAEEQSVLGARQVTCANDHRGARHRHAAWRNHQPAVGRHRFLPQVAVCHALQDSRRANAREIPLTDGCSSCLLKAAERGRPRLRLPRRAGPHRQALWKTALKNAGIRHLRFHDLRHTFNTRLMEAGVLQEIRMALMGHSSGSKVHAMYTHIELPAKREAIRKLEAWVNQQQQAT